MTWSGTLEFRNLEGGVWTLHADREYVLLGAVPSALNHRRVIVEGERAESFGIAMAGEQIEVRSVRLAEAVRGS